MGEIRRMRSSSAMKLSQAYRVTDWGRSRWSDSRVTASGDSFNTQPDLESMRAQCYAMDRNNGLFSGVLDRAIDNIVGSGPIFQMQTKDKGLNAALEERMAIYDAGEIDATGLRNKREMLRHGLRAVFTGGDHSFAKLSNGKIQGIEAGLIVDDYNKPGTASGIAHDSKGMISGFRVGRWTEYGGIDRSNTRIIPAKHMMYLPHLTRWSAERGVPVLASTIELFERLDDYIEATIVAAQVGACQAVAIATEMGGELAKQTSDTETAQDDDDQYIIEQEPGGIYYLRPGESVTQIKPEHPSTQFEPFMKSMLRLVGLPLGLPLELVLLDFSDTNYSSARAAFLQAYIGFRTWQYFLDSRFLRPLSDWKLTHFFKELGIKDTPENRKFVNIPSGWAWVDPMKEAQGAKIAIELGLTTLRDEAAKYGKFWEDNVAQRKIEIAAAKDAGMIVEVVEEEPQAGEEEQKPKEGKKEKKDE